MKKSLIISLLFLLVLKTASHAQPGDATLKQQLEGKDNLTEIMNTVKEYYKNPETIRRLGQEAINKNLKHWKRYEWYMSNRLGPNGEFVNINQKMIDATGLQQSRTINSANLVESSSGSWSAVGPFNTTNGIGRVDRLAFHPTDADIVYAGTTTGGLWRTADAGSTWTNLTPDIPSAGISGIVIDPVNPNTIYILTGDGDSNFPGGLVLNYGYMRLSIGVLKSTNGGSNWTKTGTFPGADYSTLTGYRLTINPGDNNTLYACTSQGMFMSVNAGTTWALVLNEGRIFNMKFRPGSNNICYATSITTDLSTSYLWKSTTGGITWDTVNAATSLLSNPANRTELAVTPAKPDFLYLLPGGVPGTPPLASRISGFHLSRDQGQTFSTKSIAPNILSSQEDGTGNDEQSLYDLTIAVSNTNGKDVVTGAVNIWHSVDTGASWVARVDTHGDIHELGYHPVNNKLWAATDGGVFSSTNHGATWTSHFEGMNITQFYRMAVSPENYLDMIGGSQDNAFKKRTNGSSDFEQILCCDGFAVGYDAINPDTIFAVSNRTINRSVNGGTSFTNITPPNSVNPMSMSMAVHTSLTNSLFIGSDSLWRTTNGGNTWTVSPNLASGWFLRTCPSNGNRVYLAGGNSFSSSSGVLRRSDDGGVTWPNGNILSNHTDFPNNYPKITSINVDPTNSLRVWVTFGGFTEGVKVYYANYNTNPAGLWVNMSGTLPNVPVNCIAVDNNNNAYIGTDNGVYYRSTSMNDWVPFYNNLPYVPVTELIISEAENRIRAATFGRGIWSSDLYSACPTDLNITGTLEGQEFHEASNNIVSTAGLLTSEGTKVQMRGGNEVLLLAGFTAREVTQFKAFIGACGSGGVAGFRVASLDSAESLPVQRYLPPPGGTKSMIHIHSVSDDGVYFEVNQKQNGETDLLLTDEIGNIVRSKKITTSQKGKWKNAISTAGLASGTYYLNVLLDKRVEHMQEVIIK